MLLRLAVHSGYGPIRSDPGNASIRSRRVQPLSPCLGMVVCRGRNPLSSPADRDCPPARRLGGTADRARHRYRARHLPSLLCQGRRAIANHRLSCWGRGAAPLRNAALAGIETREADCGREPLPLDSDSVDCVCLLDVIEHLPDSPKHLLREIARVLRPGGVCITSTPNAVRLSTRIKVLLGYSNWPQIADYHDLPRHAGHHHEYTERELRFVHEKAGLQIVGLQLVDLNLLQAPIQSLADLQSGHRPRAGGGRMNYRAARLLLHALTRVFPGLRGQMILAARKSAENPELL